jgi:hypothetical protein
MVERLSVEDQPPYRRWCASNGLSNAPVDIVRVREEQAIIEPIDERSRNDCGRRVQSDVGVPVQSLHPPEYRVVQSRAAPYRVDDRERHSQHERAKHTRGDHFRHGRAAIATSTRLTRARPRHAPGSIIPMAAVTMTAPRAACGRY